MTAGRRVLVVGAGIAGLACARALSVAGVHVKVLDKGRSPGGRSTSRREGDRTFDHGAPGFDATTDAMRTEVSRWEAAGVVRPWSPPGETPSWVAAPTMGALAAYLADGIDVALGHAVTRVGRRGDVWSLTTDDGAVHESDVLVLAVPAPQCASLLANTPEAREAATLAAGTPFEPCWAAMVTLRTDAPAPFVTFRAADGAVAWAACEDTKPGRTATPAEERWTVHASTAWTHAHLEEAREDVADHLGAAWLATLEAVSPRGATIASARAHRWRYARPARAGDGEPSRGFADGTLVLCGDWLARPDIEGAWTSGSSAAMRIAPR